MACIAESGDYEYNNPNFMSIVAVALTVVVADMSRIDPAVSRFLIDEINTILKA
jgi:hypothetical protein